MSKTEKLSGDLRDNRSRAEYYDTFGFTVSTVIEQPCTLAYESQSALSVE